jgi:hypothetical protein
MNRSTRNALSRAHEAPINHHGLASLNLSECSPQYQSPFFRLPVELRLQIYEDILTQDSRGYICDDLTWSWSLQKLSADLSLMYTCRRMFSEASWIPMATTTHYIRCVNMNEEYWGNSAFRKLSIQQSEAQVVPQFTRLRLTANNVAALNRVVLNGTATSAEPFRALCKLPEFQPKHVTVQGSCALVMDSRRTRGKTIIGHRRVRSFAPLPDSVHTFILTSFLYHEEIRTGEPQTEPKEFALPILQGLSLFTCNRDTLIPKPNNAISFGDFFQQKNAYTRSNWQVCRYKVCFTK